MPIRHVDCIGCDMIQTISSEMRKPCIVTLGTSYYTVVAPLCVLVEFDKRNADMVNMQKTSI